MTTTALIFRTAADVTPGTIVLDPVAPALFTVETAYSALDGRTALAGRDTTTGVYRRLTPDTAAVLATRNDGAPAQPQPAVPDTYTAGATTTAEIVPVSDLAPGDALLLDLAAVTTVTAVHTHGHHTWLTLDRPAAHAQRLPFEADETVVRIVTA